MFLQNASVEIDVQGKVGIAVVHSSSERSPTPIDILGLIYNNNNVIKYNNKHNNAFAFYFINFFVQGLNLIWKQAKFTSGDCTNLKKVLEMWKKCKFVSSYTTKHVARQYNSSKLHNSRSSGITNLLERADVPGVPVSMHDLTNVKIGVVL